MAVASTKPQCPMPRCGSFKTLFRVKLPEDDPGSSRCQVCGATWKPDGTILSKGVYADTEEEA